MRDPGLPTLDQLRVFLAVIDMGGFAHAARHLFRAQSVISYTIANLEEQLNVVLFDRNKRKLTLTEAGKASLSDARIGGQMPGTTPLSRHRRKWNGRLPPTRVTMQSLRPASSA